MYPKKKMRKNMEIKKKLKCLLFGHNIIIRYNVWETKEEAQRTVHIAINGGYCNKCNRYIKKIRFRDNIEENSLQ